MMDYEGLEPLEEFRDEFNPVSMMRGIYAKGGSSSAPAETTTTNISEPPAYVKPYSIDMLNQANNLSQQPFQEYQGDKIAGLTPEHYLGMDLTTQRALQGSPAINSATEHASNVFNDTYMNRGLDLAGQANPYEGMRNQYSGQNPHLEDMIGRSNENITDNYNKTINPQIQAMDRSNQAFGMHSGINETRADSQEALAKTLADNDSNYRYQDYLQQQGMDENWLNRNTNLASQQQMNQLAMYGNERNAQSNAMEFAPQLGEQDYINFQNLLGVGDIYRNEDQQNLDFMYDQWQQSQNYPYQQLDVLQNALANSMGSYTSNVTSAPNAYSPNSTANYIGTGLGAYGAIQGLLG